MKRIVVIGGGAAGAFAAIYASKQDNEVYLLEKKDRLGSKLRITGKGRCNITSASDLQEIINAFGRNGRFLHSAMDAFTNTEVMKFFEDRGVPVKVERGGRVFPVSDKAQDVVNVLGNELKKHRVNIKYNANVKEIKKKGKGLFITYGDDKVLSADAIIICAGGASYPGTGSTGDGYKFAEALGHTIVPLRPSLVPIETEETWPKDLMGLTLKNVELAVYVEGKKHSSEFGEMIFTHFGISGPIVLSLSKELTNVDSKDIVFAINLKPALDEEKLNTRILRDFEEFINKDIKNAMDKLLPQKLIPIVIQQAGISPDKKVHSISREERLQLIKTLYGLKLKFKAFRPLSEAIVTAGGVKLSEVNPKTMESKLVEGIYFAGEVLDLDAVTGGYNLQAAFSTGYVAGISAAE